MITFLNDPFSFSYTLLTLVGQWPYQKPIDYLPRRCFVVLVLSLFAFAQIRTLYVANFESGLLLKNAQLLSMTVVGFANLFAVYINSADYKKVLDEMYKNWRQPKSREEGEIVRKYVSESHTIVAIAAVCFTLVTALLVFVSCMPLILDVVAPLNQTRHRMLLYQLDLYIDDQEYFVVYLIFYYVSTSVGITVFVANTGTLIIAIYHLCGLFEFLGYQMEHAFDIASTDQDGETIQQVNNVIYSNIIQCVEVHCETNRFSTLLEGVLAPLIFQHLVCAAVVLSLSLAQISNVDTFNYESFINVLFNWTFLVVAMNVGQKVINLSTETGVRAYNGKWYNSPLRAQKFLLMVMKCYAPHTIHGYNIVHLSLESAQTIARTAVSYCLLLRDI